MSVKGWCPGAWRPMRSGDGLLVRVRPMGGHLSHAQAEGLAELAVRFGSGRIDLTRRANLQVRGVAEAGHAPLLEGLSALGLLDADPATEARRNILVQPFGKPGDRTARLAAELAAALGALPELPAKFGFAIDDGPAPVLSRDPADIRLEAGPEGLVLRADRAESGLAVSVSEAVAAALELARWFAARRRPDERRMAALLSRVPLPERFAGAAPRAAAPPPRPGAVAAGLLAGVPLGVLSAEMLAGAARAGRGLRLTPWRMLLVEGAAKAPRGLLDAPDPILSVDACPGAPFCAEATVATYPAARALAGRAPSVHVSGCAKGCARSGPAALTLVGRNGGFDLVKDGRSGDTPLRRGLDPERLTDALDED